MTLPQIILYTIFCINATFAVNFSFRFALGKVPNLEINRYVLCVYISSAIWTIGMGLMSICKNENFIYAYRCVGILGCFLFMIFVQIVLSSLSGVEEKIRKALCLSAESGIIVYLMYILPGHTIFVQTEFGTTFYFVPGPVTTIYALYFTIISLNIFLTTIYMIRHNKRKMIRKAGTRFMIVELLVFVGAVTDMLFPVFGKPAFPGSVVTQFWGVFVFWFTIQSLYKSNITITNMSEYIYYSLAIPTLVFDENGRLVIMNDASGSFFERRNNDESIKGLTIMDLFYTKETIFDFEGKAVQVQAKCRANGSNCEISISKIQDPYGDIIGYILIVGDLSEHEMVIKSLEEAKLAADSANMSKSMFLANMSHEIRTPMNAILGFSELALSGNLDEKSKEYFTDIRRSGETLLSIINDILNISKIELGKQELANVDYNSAKLLKDVELIIGMQASKKDLEFVMNISPELPKTLHGDPDKIREILINLLNNSVKYTKTGRIKFDGNVISRDGENIVLEFKVSDTGIGIKSEDIGLIFDKFSRVDAKINSRTEGTGLGLAITKGLIEMMGGEVKVESIYGVGSTFTVNIPQRVVDATPIDLNEEEITEDTNQFKYNGGTVLAVDDNRTNLKVVSALLKKYEIPFELASSGKEAIQLCRDKAFSLVLMDQMMPEMDGVEAMRHIREIPGYTRDDETKIIALTANVIEGAKEELLAAGFDGFLGKPIKFKEFEKIMS